MYEKPGTGPATEEKHEIGTECSVVKQVLRGCTEIGTY